MNSQTPNLLFGVQSSLENDLDAAILRLSHEHKQTAVRNSGSLDQQAFKQMKGPQADSGKLGPYSLCDQSVPNCASEISRYGKQSTLEDCDYVLS